MQPARLDPVTFSIVWNGLISVAEEMGLTLASTAYSEAVREAQDFSTSVFDDKGRLVAQGDFSPGHLGSMPFAVKNAIRYFPPETLQPGDGILLNDMALGSGHYPDFILVTPVFFEGELIGFTANCAHHIDVGGAGPGSQAVEGVREAYQEGLRILPVKLYRRGQIEEDIFRIITGNVRVPDVVAGDLRAQRNANRIGELRLQEMAAKHGLSTLRAALEELIERSEEATREAIRQIPDGVYSFEDFLDDTGPNTPPVRVYVTVTVDGDEITVDFTGSSPQTQSGLNSYINYTKAYAFFAVKCVTCPFIPQNEGCVAPIKVVAPEGSFFNPRHPAPGGARAITQIRIFEAVNGALAQAIPDRVVAAYSHWGNPNIGGVDPRTGKNFVYYDVIMGGYGGRSVKDGCEGLCPVFNARNIPVEVHESAYPVMIERLELMRDSSGPGRNRGGCGLRKDVKVITDAVLMNLGERHQFAPYGLFGGKPGSRAATVLNPGPEERMLHSKGTYQLKAGDVVSFRLAGGGGYGNPLERETSAVVRDVQYGYISADEAREKYGVVINPIDLSVEEDATEGLRGEMRQIREREA